MSKRIAIVGSSGGNLYNQGGSNPAAMMKEIFTQADSAGIEIAFIQFIGAQATMDNISMDTAAQLFTLAEGQVEAGESAPLREINQQAQSLDEELARLIDEGEIDGLVLMSCDPKGVNSRAVAIAAKQVSGLDEVGIVAGIICGVMSTDGGIIDGLVTGILAGILAYYIITFCLSHKVPGTTANIAAGGLAGLIAGFVGMYAIAPVALWFGNGVKSLIEACLTFSPLLAGADGLHTHKSSLRDLEDLVKMAHRYGLLVDAYIGRPSDLHTFGLPAETPEEVCRVARQMEEAGADMIGMMTGMSYEGVAAGEIPTLMKERVLAMVETVKVPTLAEGGINTVNFRAFKDTKVNILVVGTAIDNMVEQAAQQAVRQFL